MTTPVSLKQLAEGKADGVQKATYFKISPDVIEFEDGFNLREEGAELDEHLERMYRCHESRRVLPSRRRECHRRTNHCPCGHCRTRTAKRLKKEGVDIMLEARQFRGNEAECVFHMISSSQGKPLTPLESGRGYLRLIRYGLEVPAICARTVIRKHGSKATEVLRETLDKAKAGGNSKVTKKHVAGPRVPPRVVKSFVAAAASLHQHVRHDIRESLLKASEDEIAGMGDIPVPAATLKALLSAHSEIEPDGDAA